MKMKSMVCFACAVAMVASVGCSGPSSGGSAAAGDQSDSTLKLVATPDEGDSAESTDQSAAAEEPAKSEPEPEAKQTAPQQSSFPEMTAEEAMAQGYDQMFEGTVRVMDVDESLQMLGLESGVGMFDGECVALMFDSPIEVTATSAAGYSNTQASQLLGLTADMASSNADDGWVDPWRPLDGQRYTIAVRQDGMWFPTEINPFGENPITTAENIVIVK